MRAVADHAWLRNAAYVRKRAPARRIGSLS